jgi:homogentisate 1,2-dioxygenase
MSLFPVSSFTIENAQILILLMMTTNNDQDRSRAAHKGEASASGWLDILAVEQIKYQTGFQNSFESEYIPGALPLGRNNPLHVPFHLFTEQLSGTAFTVSPRLCCNQRSWLYRTQPSITTLLVPSHSPGVEADSADGESSLSQPGPYPEYLGYASPASCHDVVPQPYRWHPFDFSFVKPGASSDVNFVQGLHLHAAGGDHCMQSSCSSVGTNSGNGGVAMYYYGCNADMFLDSDHSDRSRSTTSSSYFVNYDGDILIVPQTGPLLIFTELGRLAISPGEVIVIPRNIVFSVNLLASEEPGTSNLIITHRGYMLEVIRGLSGQSFTLPELGPIGSNGLANSRDFQYPTAWCSGDPTSPSQQETRRYLIRKYGSRLHVQAHLAYCAFNVVAWHGNYGPYKYNLHTFCTMGNVAFDHSDPSILTVLTVPNVLPSRPPLLDFVIFPSSKNPFPPTDQNTFRPPWFHRNTVMTEYMGLIYGSYNAKSSSEFVPGSISLHVAGCPHGPDTSTYTNALKAESNDGQLQAQTQPGGGLAFMFETAFPLKVVPEALQGSNGWCLDTRYIECWRGLLEDDAIPRFNGWDVIAAKKQQEAFDRQIARAGETK